MSKIATLAYLTLCLAAPQAFAGPDGSSEQMLAMAGNSGLWVRVAAASTDTRPYDGNVCGSAVNTGGVTRATQAVKVGNRVFLTGSNMARTTGTALASRSVPAGETRKAPEGLGNLLAKLFGCAG